VEEISFSGLVVVAAVALLAPLLLGLAPRLRLPSVVLEIVAGIVVGPALLGWVEIDTVIRVFALFGLAYLLFLAGLEIDFERLRGRSLRLAGIGFVLSFAIALVVGYGLETAGQVENGLIVAIILSATSLGVVVPLLKDAGEVGSPFGQLTIAAASIADFATVIILTLFFSREATGTGAQLLLLAGFVVAGAVAVVGLLGLERSSRLSAALLRLQDTTAQIRVRGAFLLLAGFVALAENLGLEVILGAFTAGAILSLVDRDALMTHPHFRTKLEGAGFGFFIPVFFVSVGLAFNLDALLASAETVLRVPIFLVALLAVRGLPAIVYRRLIGPRRTVVAGLLQATSLPFIVAASMIGVELGVISEATSAALIGAGLLSVLIFPLVAATILGRGGAGLARPADGGVAWSSTTAARAGEGRSS
jgi:Kef-type K+ transport system membrane component KefB